MRCREKHTDLDLLLQEVDFVLLLQELLLLPGNLLGNKSEVGKPKLFWVFSRKHTLALAECG